MNLSTRNTKYMDCLDADREKTSESASLRAWARVWIYGLEQAVVTRGLNYLRMSSTHPPVLC